MWNDRAYVLAYSGHRHIRAHGEQPHADYKKARAYYEGQHNAAGYGDDHKAQQKYNGSNRQHGFERFAQLFGEDGS